MSLMAVPAPPAQAHMGAGGAVPQVRDLTQLLWQVILVLSLGGQLQVPAERIQPHRVGPADGVGLGGGWSGRTLLTPLRETGPHRLLGHICHKTGGRGWWKCPLPVTPVGASSPHRSHKNQDNIPIRISFGVEASPCTQCPKPMPPWNLRPTSQGGERGVWPSRGHPHPRFQPVRDALRA